MTIYLDNCTLQDLKKEDHKSLLDLIMRDKNDSLYCFSEAHLYDLNRDSSDHKFADMDFMETIVKNHCFFYNEHLQFAYYTPRQYYDRFDWPTDNGMTLFEGDDPILSMITTMFKAMPLNFRSFISEEDLPADAPEEVRRIILEPTTMYDFMVTQMNIAEELTEHQKRFKVLLQYLHKNAGIYKLYESMGVEGYDGEKVTDKEKFKTSYANHFTKHGLKRNDYELFTDMYVGLELFGFVKGKPKKQKFMNLINDARHAYFAAACDMMISSDKDFIEKTEFMYSFLDVPTGIRDISGASALIETLINHGQQTFTAMVGETVATDLQERFIGTSTDEQSQTVLHSFWTSRIYFHYFTVLAFVETTTGNYCFFTKRSSHASIRLLTKELEHVVNRFAEQLGPDANGKGQYDLKEAQQSSWPGRMWIIGEFCFVLDYSKNMQLTVYTQEYLKAHQTEK